MTAIIELMLGIIFIGTEFMPWQEQYQLWTCLLIIIFWIIEVYGTVQAKEKYTEVYFGCMMSILAIQLFKNLLLLFLNMPLSAQFLLLLWNSIRITTQLLIIDHLGNKIHMKDGYESL